MKQSIRIVLSFFALTLVLSFQNCSNGKFFNYKDPGVDVFAAPKLVGYSSLRYFLGGWYGPADQPNWSYDYTINFDSRNLTSRMPDAFCGKSRNLSDVEFSQLTALIESTSLKIKSPYDLTVMDGASETIEFKLKADLQKTDIVYLSADSGQPGSSVFINPKALSDFMKSLLADNSKFVVFCQ